MALVDALLEISRQWDSIEPSLAQRTIAVTRALSASDNTSAAGERAERVLDLVSRSLPTDSTVFAALELHTDRGTRDDPALTLLALSEPLPEMRQPRRPTSVEDFALCVLDERLSPKMRSIRRFARRRVLHFWSMEGDRHQLALAAPIGGRTRYRRPFRASRPAVLETSNATLLRFNPIEAFLSLPRSLQTLDVARFAAATDGQAYILPTFQLSGLDRGASVIDAAAETNEILSADRDPWGAASWWTRPNGRLGATPADLLGTDRQDEIAAAAEALALDVF